MGQWVKAGEGEWLRALARSDRGYRPATASMLCNGCKQSVRCNERWVHLSHVRFRSRQIIGMQQQARKGSRLLIAAAVPEEDRPKSAADVRASLSFAAMCGSITVHAVNWYSVCIGHSPCTRCFSMNSYRHCVRRLIYRCTIIMNAGPGTSRQGSILHHQKLGVSSRQAPGSGK